MGADRAQQAAPTGGPIGAPRMQGRSRYSAATGAGFSIGTPMRLPYSVHEPS